MSQLTTAPEMVELSQLAKLSVSIRGKLQFMDYLVRAAVADVERYHEETDPGTRIFIRQLIEMHAASLAAEGDNIRLVGELCHALESVIHHDPGDGEGGDHGHGFDHDLGHGLGNGMPEVHRNGDSE